MKFTVDYGTIHGMVVELPSGCNAITFIGAWAKAFVGHMTERSLVSDEVLFSSIGESNCRKAMIAGIEERLHAGKVSEKVAEVFIKEIKNDLVWEASVLRSRYGSDWLSRFLRRQGLPEGGMVKAI